MSVRAELPLVNWTLTAMTSLVRGVSQTVPSPPFPLMIGPMLWIDRIIWAYELRRSPALPLRRSQLMVWTGTWRIETWPAPGCGATAWAAGATPASRGRQRRAAVSVLRMGTPSGVSGAVRGSACRAQLTVKVTSAFLPPPPEVVQLWPGGTSQL